MVIKINYTSSDVYVSTSVSPVYVVVNYSAVNNAGGVAWGAITGTLSDQTDLQTALDAKFDDPTGTTAQYLRGDGSLATFPAIPGGTVTSVGLTMPSAFAVANSPVTSSGTLAVTGAGTADQYVRGDGQLANFPTNQGGGSSVNYYLNGSVNQGTFGGDTYYEMSKTPIIGSGTNFTRTNAQGNGYIASFITDAGDPALLNIPGGNWNLEFYFAASSSGSTPSFYAELYKVSSSNVFTLISSGSTNPEGITNGTVIDQYFTSIPVPQTSLLATDRLAIRIFVTPSGRTITLHTEDNNLCEVLTTFSTGLNALNGLTSQVQYFATGTSGTDFAISSATDTHTFNLPTASGTNRGALSSADWTTFSGKVGGTGVSGQVAYWNGTNSVTGSSNLTYSGGYLTNTNTFTDSAILVMRANQTTYQSFIGVGTVGAYSPTNLFWSFGLVTGNQDFNIQSYNGTTISSRIKIYASTGNISLNAGANADGGQRLQVYGDAFVSGSISIADGQWIRQSGMSAGGFRYTGNNIIFYNSANNSIFTIPTGSTSTTVTFEGISATSLTVSRTYNHTSSTSNAVSFTNTFAPTSGTGIFNVGLISTTINQTGGANGITRGLYVNPTLTAAADWRSIEWSNNSGWGLYGAGTANNFLGGNLTISRNQNAGTTLTINNTTSGTSAGTKIVFGNDGNNAACTIEKLSSTTTPYKFVASSDYAIYNGNISTNGDICIFNDRTAGIIKFGAGSSSTAQMTLTAAGRLLLGTTTEGTFLLDVNGTARVSGNTTIVGNLTLARSGGGTFTFQTTTFLEDAVSTASRCVLTNGGQRLIFQSASSGFNLFAGSIGEVNTTAQLRVTNRIVSNANGVQVAIGAYASSAISVGTYAATGTYTLDSIGNLTGGQLSGVRIAETFTASIPTQSIQYTGYTFESTINQTGGANGITRGLYINPILTSAADWRAIEVSAGVSVLAPSSTASATLRIPSGTAPTSPVNGDIWFDGTDLKMRIGGVTKTFTLV